MSGNVELELLLEAAKVNMELAQIQDANDRTDAKLATTKKDADAQVADIGALIEATDVEVKKRIATWYGSISEADKETLQALQRALGVVRSIYSMVKQCLHAVGVSIPPVLGAVISFAFQVAATLLSIAQANSSNPYTLALGIITMISAIASLASAIETETKAQQIQSEIEGAKSLFNQQGSEVGYEAVII